MEVPYGSFGGMTLLGDDTVAVYIKTKDKRFIRSYSLSTGCELRRIQLMNACRFAEVKVSGQSTLALAF